MQARAALAYAVLALAIARTTKPARADPPARRPVAVISLDPKADDEAKKVRAALQQSAQLGQLREPADETALAKPLVAEDGPALAEAQKALADARAALEKYNIDDTISAAEHGLEQLESAAPQAAVRLYADLMFERGVAQLGKGKPTDAKAAFALVKLLAPDRKLDDDLLPEIVAAYEHAKPPGGTGTLELRGTGRAWIDGAEVGPAPGAYPVAAGLHLVQVTGPEREPRGAHVDVPVKGVQVDIADAPISRERRIMRARAEIAAAPDELARAAAVQRFATLVDVHDVVLLGAISEGTATRLTEQTWQDTFGFSSTHAPEQPATLLNDLSPQIVESPPIPFEKPPPPEYFPPKLPPPELPLYERRWFQGTVAGVVVTAIITGIVIGTHEGTIGVLPSTLGANKGWQQ